MKRIATLLAGFAALPAFAHGGHGSATDIHWHATDTAGFVLVGVLVALAIWFSRGD
ncbi:hypothetical protein [Ramlibacter sp.]|uniref:hypothetical protein n=1 Tax=Ramlibacter sp. TaxID=1917967 RepID=UPI003D10A80A